MTTQTQPAPTDMIITHEGRPIYALIEYDLYLALKARIEEWRTAHLKYQAKEIELVQEAQRVKAKGAPLVTLAEVKQRIAAKQVAHVAD